MATTKRTARLLGYDVEFEAWDEDGQRRTSVMIYSTASGASASLGYAEDNGTLYDLLDGEDVRIHDRALDAIRSWADGLGY